MPKRNTIRDEHGNWIERTAAHGRDAGRDAAGRPTPGRKPIPRDDPPAGGPSDDGDDDDGDEVGDCDPAGGTGEPLVVHGYQFYRRDKGEYPPASIQKLVLAIRDLEMTRIHLQRACGITNPNRITQWERVAGKIPPDAAVCLARTLGIPLDYLLDDSIPAQSPPPGRDGEAPVTLPIRDMVDQFAGFLESTGLTVGRLNEIRLILRTMDLTMDELASYAFAVAMAKACGVSPAQLGVLARGHGGGQDRGPLQDRFTDPNRPKDSPRTGGNGGVR